MDPRSNSVTVTATELQRVKSLTDGIDRRDFGLTNNDDSNSPRQQEEQGVKLPCAYLLREISPDIWSLTPTTDLSSASYTFGVKRRTTSITRRCTKEIVKDEDGTSKQVAEYYSRGDYTAVLRYNRSGPSDKSKMSFVTHVGPHRYQCRIDCADYIWERLGGGAFVNVLSDQAGKRVALFLFPVKAQKRVSYQIGQLYFHKSDVGELHLIDVCGGGQQMLEKLMFAIVVVLEMQRQWCMKFGEED